MVYPPSNSKITVEDDQGDQVITVPASSNPARYFIAAFLLFWLGGWLMGEVGVLTAIISGITHPNVLKTAHRALEIFVGLFMLFWLGAWTVGGFFAARTFLALLVPSRPEKIILTRNQIDYQEPSADLNYHRGVYQRNGSGFWKQGFKKPRKLTFSLADAQTLTLRNQGEVQRLTIDQGIERISLAEQATEIEREWLYKVLTDCVTASSDY